MSYIKTIEEIAANYARKLGISIKLDKNLAYSTENQIVLPNVAANDERSERFIYGLMAHEAGHVHYSDFKIFANITNPILKELVNALEDCRIEYLISKNYIGAFENLNFINQCIYRHHWERISHKSHICKIKTIIIYLLIQTQANYLNYQNSQELAALLKKELSCLINPNMIALLEEFTHKVVEQQSTQDLYNLARQIYQLFYQEQFFVPNFERFLLANNTLSAFDINNAKALAKLYHQSFQAPILGPNKEALDICSCQELIDNCKLKLNEHDLNDLFIPQFISPLLPDFNQEHINLKYLVKSAPLEDIKASIALSNSAVGSKEETLFLCKFKYYQDKIYDEQFALLDVNETLKSLLSNQDPCALNEDFDTKDFNKSLDEQHEHALKQDKSKKTEQTKSKRSLNKDTIGHINEKFSPLDRRLNPLYGPFKDKESLLAAIEAYQNHLKELDNKDPNVIDFINCDFSFLLNDMAYSTNDEKGYDKLIKPNLSIELATRMILMQVANPMRYQPLMRFSNLPYYYQIKDDIKTLFNQQEHYLDKINALRKTSVLAPNTKQEVKALSEQCKKDFTIFNNYYGMQNQRPHIVKAISESLDRSCSFPTFNYDQSLIETKLLHLDQGYEIKAYPTSALDEMFTIIMEQRAAAKFQRQEAILKEMNLYDEQNIAPHLTIDPKCYCKDSCGHVYLKYYYQRTLAAMNTMLLSGLNYQDTSIPMVVDKNFFIPIYKYHKLHRFCSAELKARYGYIPKNKYQSPKYIRPNENYYQELFKDPSFISSWSQDANPKSDHSPFGTKTIEDLEKAYKRMSMHLKRDNSLYPRYVRFINNLAFNNENQQLRFHKDLIERCDRNTLNIRDPREENSFSDALREYYFEAYQHSKQQSNKDMPSNSSCNNGWLNNYQHDLTDNSSSLNPLQNNERSNNYDGKTYGQNIHIEDLKNSDFVGMLTNMSRARDEGQKQWRENKHHIQNALGQEQQNFLLQEVIQKEQQAFIDSVITNLSPLRKILEDRLFAYYQSREQSHCHGKKIDIRKAQLIDLGEEKIFKQKSLEPKADTLVHLLIDVSSSMGSKNSFMDKCLHFDRTSAGYIACQSALNIALSLEKVPMVRCEVTYFPGAIPKSNYLPVLYEHEKASDKAQYFLQIPRFYTPTAVTINYVVDRMMHQHYRRKIIIVITDGMPDKPKDTIRAILNANKQHIELYSLGIFKNSGIKELIKSIFPNITNLDDYTMLPASLSKLIASKFN